MKVYGLYHIYYTSSDSYENLINVYAKREDAEADQIKLSSHNHDSEIDSWYVYDLDVI